MNKRIEAVWNIIYTALKILSGDLNRDDIEFIKLAYAKGKVQDASQAFEDFSPEEEWHGGKIENVFEEENIKYGPYSVGDIVFVKKYKYADGTTGFDHFFCYYITKQYSGTY